MGNVSSSDNEDVGADVVSCNKIFNMVFSDVSDIFSDTEDGLTDEVVTEGGVVNSLQSGLFLISVIFNAVSVDFFSFQFDLVFVI